MNGQGGQGADDGRGCRAFFDGVAARYDRTFAPSHRETAADLAPLLARLAEGAVVVDAGCGTGRAWPHLLERGARVVGLDASAAMLRASGARASAPRVARLRCDLAGRWPLREGAADAVIALHASLAHPIGDPWRFFAHVGREIRRALSPKGWVAVDLPDPAFARRELVSLGDDWFRFEALGPLAAVATFVPEPARVVEALGLPLELSPCATGFRAFGALESGSSDA